MGRKFKEVPPKILENIMKESLSYVGITDMEEGRIKLLLRLLMSNIGNYYFKNPDDIINIGFLKFEKSPDKDELFRVCIKRDTNSGILNAQTLWEYYNGNLVRERLCKEVVEDFLEGLINYSQEQEMNIMDLTNNIEKEKKEKGGKNHGVQKNK